jgi:hypothetical protein
MEGVFQLFYAKLNDYSEMNWLSREWLGRFGDRDVMELILRLTYNVLHIDSKFEWREMSIEEYLQNAIKNYIHPGDRGNRPDDTDLLYSRGLDDLIHEMRGKIEVRLSDTELIWSWWEPMISIVRRTSLEIEMYDHRAYVYMADLLESRKDEDDDEGYY